ncbi:uncharacterized protein LOC119513995 isoform X1 [Choloepus didactylus]|uniref:uncharacterized protein LOC119513995 isoform X1 n=1 Tax=Choloepus didactylus TaxID=27675 RepID=UPI0018A00AED|nr:uncharacterized protein LOC119513995 isoform X1 [Choloepus didactylus]
MGLNLTEEEMKDLRSNLPVNADGKVAMRILLDALKAFTGPKVDVRCLQDILNHMGIELTDKEQMKLLKTLPIDAAGKIYKNRLLDDVKSLKKGKVKRSKMNIALENLGIKLTEKEIKSLVENLPDNANGKIELKTLMDTVTAVTGEVDVNDEENILGKIGIDLTDKDCLELEKNLPVDADGKVYQNRLKDDVKSLKRKKVDANDLLKFLGNMGIELTEKERVKLLQTLPTDGGMVSFDNLDTVLGNLGVELTKKEYEDLAKNLPLNANGKVDLNTLMETWKLLQLMEKSTRIDSWMV